MISLEQNCWLFNKLAILFWLLMISLDLTKSSEVRKAGDQSIHNLDHDMLWCCEYFSSNQNDLQHLQSWDLWHTTHLYKLANFLPFQFPQFYGRILEDLLLPKIATRSLVYKKRSKSMSSLEFSFLYSCFLFLRMYFG